MKKITVLFLALSLALALQASNCRYQGFAGVFLRSLLTDQSCCRPPAPETSVRAGELEHLLSERYELSIFLFQHIPRLLFAGTPYCADCRDNLCSPPDPAGAAAFHWKDYLVFAFRLLYHRAPMPDAS